MPILFCFGLETQNVSGSGIPADRRFRYETEIKRRNSLDHDDVLTPDCVLADKVAFYRASVKSGEQ
jgi:hypothetical protein